MTRVSRPEAEAAVLTTSGQTGTDDYIQDVIALRAWSFFRHLLKNWLNMNSIIVDIKAPAQLSSG